MQVILVCFGIECGIVFGTVIWDRCKLNHIFVYRQINVYVVFSYTLVYFSNSCYTLVSQSVSQVLTQ